MKLIFSFFALSFILLARAIAQYPATTSSSPEFNEAEVDKLAEEKLKRYIDLSGGGTPKTQDLLRATQQISQTISPQIWPLVHAPSRISLPAVLIRPIAWMEIPGFVANLNAGLSKQADMEAYTAVWGVLLGRATDTAFSIMAEDAKREEVQTVDLLRFRASRGYWPGSKLPKSPTKAFWKKLHESKNPCYKLIALEYFDSVEQTASELFALYEECLMAGCSYLEIRAMEAISANADHQKKVVELLRQYATTRLIENDGTLYPTRTHFEGMTPQKAAMRLAEAIEKQIQAGGEKAAFISRPLSTGDAIESNEASQILAPAKPPHFVPSTWLALAAVILAALGLVWLFFLKRKP